MRIYRLSLDKRWLWRAMPIAALTACVLAASAGRAVAAQEEEGAGPPAVHDNRRAGRRGCSTGSAARHGRDEQIGRADPGARTISRCLPGRLAGREDRGTGTDRHRVRKPDLPDRRHGDFEGPPSTIAAGRRTAWVRRREGKDAR